MAPPINSCIFVKQLKRHLSCNYFIRNSINWSRSSLNKEHSGIENQNDKNEAAIQEEFRTYEIPDLKPQVRDKKSKRMQRPMSQPRYLKMRPEQDWTNVWPAAATFKWSVVPFPIRQGYSENMGENKGVSQQKYANAELMKVPNFLHLTVAHIKKQCAAIKHLCTDWPDGLFTDDDCEKNFPMEVTTCDYIFSSPSVRDTRARTVSAKLKLSRLEMDEHARHKFIDLVGDRYDKQSDTVTIASERCPTKKQNYEYIQYLLTALYFESWRVEAWEADKTEDDVVRYTWHKSRSKVATVNTVRAIEKNDEQNVDRDASTDDDLCMRPDVERYRESVTQIENEGENAETISEYKRSVLGLLQLSPSRAT